MQKTQHQRIRIAIVGYSGAGKDTVAKYLVSRYGFTFVSTSDWLRDYVRSHNLGEPTRPTIQKLALDLRQKFGGDYLVKEALKVAEGNLVVGSLRAVPEIIGLKELGGKVIEVEAPLKMRYELAQKRGDLDSRRTFEEFCAFEKHETKSDDPNAQNVSGVVALADFKVLNTGSKDDLFKQIDELMFREFGLK